jgi:hypothetical protein
MVIRLLVALVVACAAVAGSAAAQELKVKMPKEGSFAFDFCYAGNFTVGVARDDFLGATYDVGTTTRTAQRSAPFDFQSGRCRGTYLVVAGKVEALGFCEYLDADGDKWWLAAHGGAGGGTYEAVAGTGKYTGMTLKGEWRETPYPSAPDTAQGCHTTTGTYRLK